MRTIVPLATLVVLWGGSINANTNLLEKDGINRCVNYYRSLGQATVAHKVLINNISLEKSTADTSAVANDHTTVDLIFSDETKSLIADRIDFIDNLDWIVRNRITLGIRVISENSITYRLAFPDLEPPGDRGCADLLLILP